MKKIAIALAALLLVTAALLTACGGGGTTATTAATGTTAAANPGALQTVINAAKTEGSVDYFCAGHTYDAAKFKAGIKATFGVDLTVNIIPGDQRQTLSNLLMQAKAGTAPQYDVGNFASPNIVGQMQPANLVANIDWASLLSNSPMDASMLMPAPLNVPATWSYVTCLAYNADKTSADKIPQSYDDFSKATYKGQLGFVKYAPVVAELLYYKQMANASGVTWLQNIISNAPVLSSWNDLADKVNLGELQASIIASQEYERVAKQNPQVKWAIPKDLVIVEENSDVVLAGCKHPNAATLLVLWLCTPDGRAYNASTGFGSYKDSGTVENDMVTQAKAQNTPVYYPERDTAYMTWVSSADTTTFTNQLNSVMTGAAK